MIVEQIWTDNAYRNFNYLIACPETGEALAILQLTASANIIIDDGLLRFLQSQAPELGTLIAMGYLRRDGSVYKLNAEVGNGLVTINGAPMAIPMTGL